MKRVTVTLPDDVADNVKRAAGGDGHVSAYVARALADYQERQGLDDVVASWGAETPVPDEVQRQVEAELDDAGLTAPGRRRSRHAG